MSTREIRRRIKSIKNTRQITKAMEMVAASKMQKAVNSALASRNYSRLAWELITNLSQITNPKLHILLQKREGNRILLVLATSDRGLCGMYNSNIIKSFIEFVKGLDGDSANVDVLVIGKKGEDMVKRLRKNIVASFVKFSDNPNILDTRAIAKVVLDDYINDKYDKVYLAYTDYISALRQVSKVKQLLPLMKIEGLNENGENPSNSLFPSGNNEKEEAEYLFEPNTEEVLEVMLPRLVEMQIYQAILESKASEHSSRMLAMKNASDGALDLVDDLTFTYNQIRQSNITSELADIIGGRIALE